MIDPSGICWRCTHLDIVPSLQGRFVCAAHTDEEPKILKVLKELSGVQQAIVSYLDDTQIQRQHPSQGQVLQDVIAELFLKAHPDLRSGTAYRINLTGNTQSELDVIIDFDSVHWLGNTRRHVMAPPPLAHIEVSYRSRFELTKLKADFQRVHDTVIAGAALQPSRKVWTAIVGLGCGWEGHRDAIAQAVHEHFHNQPPRRIDIAGTESFWDFPDVVVLPGLILKKHDFASEPGILDHWPVYAEMLSAVNDPARQFRPLAIARGFFDSFVHAVRQGKLDVGPPWSEGDLAAVFGPNVRLEDSEQMVVCLTHAPPNLFARDPQPEGHTRFLCFHVTQARCDLRKAYRYERYRGSSFGVVGLVKP